MSNDNELSPSEVEKIIQKVNAREKSPAPAINRSGWQHNAVQLAAKGVIGAAIGVAGGMVLVTAAAAAGGAILSWTALASVLGIAGASGGVAHGIVETNNRANPSSTK